MAKSLLDVIKDLANHIRGDPKTVHGIWSMVKSSTALLDTLVHKQGTGYETTPLIQRGTTSMRNATAVVFTVAFKAGCVPTVMGSVVAPGSDCYFSVEPTPTNTGFAGTVKDSAGNFQTLSVNWIAVGEKA